MQIICYEPKYQNREGKANVLVIDITLQLVMHECLSLKVKFSGLKLVEYLFGIAMILPYLYHFFLYDNRKYIFW